MSRFRLALPAVLCSAFACGTVEDPPVADGTGSTTGGGGSPGGSGGAAGGGGGSAGGGAGSPSAGGQVAAGGSESGGSSNGGAGGSASSGGDGGESNGSGGTQGSGGEASGGSTSAGTCGGDTPHGCYVPRPNNPNGCPPQIYEQSSFYPPPDEWEACSSPPFVPCVYDKPEGGEAAECRCNLGQHWLCRY